MSDDAEHQRVDPWIPMTKPIDIEHVGKLMEELNECGAALARCLIQGIDECEPDTKKINRLWLQQEIADVLANCALVIQHFNLSLEEIYIRKNAKMSKLRVWHRMLEPEETKL